MRPSSRRSSTIIVKGVACLIGVSSTQKSEAHVISMSDNQTGSNHGSEDPPKIISYANTPKISSEKFNLHCYLQKGGADTDARVSIKFTLPFPMVDNFFAWAAFNLHRKTAADNYYIRRTFARNGRIDVGRGVW